MKQRIELNPSQWAFIQAEGYAEYGIWGGQGGGKTYVALLKLLTHLHETPKANVWACRKTITQGKESLFTDFLEKTCPADWVVRVNEAERIVAIKSVLCKHTNSKQCPLCSEIRFKPLDDITKIESVNLSALLIDQAEETTLPLLVKIKRRLRKMVHLKCGGSISHLDGIYKCQQCGVVPITEVSKTLMITLGNPAPGWPEQRYSIGTINYKKISKYAYSCEKIIPAKEEGKEDTKILIINVDNRENSRWIPATYYSEACADYSEDMIERMLHGSWKHFSGSVLKCLKPEYHFTKSFNTDGWEKWMAYDYGVTNPFAMLVFAKQPDTGRIYVIDEMYASQKFLPEQVDSLRILYERHFINHHSHRKMADLYYDNSMVDADGSGKSNFIIFSELLDKIGLYEYINPIMGEKAEQAGINLYNMLFKRDKLFVFSDKCPNVVREWPGIKYKESSLTTTAKTNESEQIVDKNNHTFDAGKYGLNNEHVDESHVKVRDKKREVYDSGQMQWSDPDYEKYEDEQIKFKQEKARLDLERKLNRGNKTIWR